MGGVLKREIISRIRTIYSQKPIGDVSFAQDVSPRVGEYLASKNLADLRFYIFRSIANAMHPSMRDTFDLKVLILIGYYGADVRVESYSINT